MKNTSKNNSVSVSDTKEQFSADLYDYMVQMQKDGLLNQPVGVGTREEAITDMVKQLDNKLFDGPYDTLLYLAKLTPDSGVDDLLNRLAKLEKTAVSGT